jgi:hypothetical protein
VPRVVPVTYLGDTGDVSAGFQARDDVDTLTFGTSGTYFRALAEIRDTGRTLTEDEWTEFFARHDQYRAG